MCEITFFNGEETVISTIKADTVELAIREFRADMSEYFPQIKYKILKIEVSELPKND
jgi:hypothetical protein